MIDPTRLLDALVRRIERASNKVGNNNHATHLLRQTGDKLLEHFPALRPEKFDKMMEPWRAKQWLREMDSIFRAIDCSEVEKRRLATFQLTYTAIDWWEAEKATLGAETIRRMTWVTFKERFLAKYFPLVERNLKKKKFMELTQGNRTVQEYTTQFERMSRFAYHMIDTPAKKNEQYHQGLSLTL